MAAITCCPKCGGTNGYEAILVMRYVMGNLWGQEWETTGLEKQTFRSKFAKCADCGHRVKLSVAIGENE